MIVMKFGGTSVADSQAIERSIGIIGSKLAQHPIVVVSALSKVTDTLYKISDAAEQGRRGDATTLMETLKARHLKLAEELLTDSALLSEARATVEDVFGKMSTLVDSVCMIGELTPRSKARILSKGEWLSSNIICYAMRQRGIDTAFVDARQMIVTEGDYLKGRPIISEINERVPAVINEAYNGHDAVITQGYISSDSSGVTTVLGRGGSDYTASLIGMGIDATEIQIWTDVDGVKTADPRRVPNTKSIERISFEEAAEMAHFGAKVLHPQTIEPAVTKNIPVYVLNSMNPGSKGTAILQNDQIEDGVKSISFKEEILLVNIFSTSMIEVSGFLSRVFSIFKDNQLSVDLISTSEANISLTLDGGQNLDAAVEQLSEFAEVRVYTDKSQVSIIGKNVVDQRGLLRWSMVSLNNTSIYMISQGASSVNISLVIDRTSLDEVLHELHKYLFEY